MGLYYTGTQDGSGPIPGGLPNALAYFDATGLSLTSDAQLTAAPQDVYGRPQLLDRRQLAGVGAVWRQGGWQADGDPVNLTGEGIVIYGPYDSSTGNFARIKSDRFGIRRIFGSLDGYAWRVDINTLYLRRDADGSISFSVDRATGNILSTGTLQLGGPTGPVVRAGAGSPEGVVVGSPGDLYLNTNGGAGTTLWVKESGSATNTGWISK